MKSLKLILASLFIITACSLHAQVGVNINIGTPPPWGPAGYSQVRYYYLPDVESYYDVQSSQFIYYGSGGWLHRPYLPNRYRHYDLYSGYKVVMVDYHGTTPYTHFKDHKVKYSKGYHGPPQKTNKGKPGKGNSGSKKYFNDHSDKQSNQDKGQEKRHDNEKNKSKGNKHGGGKNKK